MCHNKIISHLQQTSRRLIAEFEHQSFIQVIFPHKDTDWIDYLALAKKTFTNIIKTIAKYEKCIVVCVNIQDTKRHFADTKNIEFIKYQTDDTWARDCSAISICENGEIKLLNFTFTGWGDKFNAIKDNNMNQAISHFYKHKMIDIDFILEGGAIESNGHGLLLTTSRCMLNRNKTYNKKQTIIFLKNIFGVKDILCLDYGYLAGDDTDSHIDTLARFIDKKTIIYITCKDKNDEHYQELLKMQEQLCNFANKYNLKLIPLPFTDALYYNNERLPATYLNFLIINSAVLVPIYSVKQDDKALAIFRKTFKNKEIIPIDCSILIRQHGSLHCVSMQFA